MSNIILINKPFRVLSQFEDSENRATLKNFLPNHPGFYPAGRLDYDSEGLMLLTNSGALQHAIAHPSQKLWKTYWVQVEGAPLDSDLEPLRNGVQLKDGMTKPGHAHLIDEPVGIWNREPPIRERKNIPTQWLEIKINEGKNRQVRRMTAAIGFPTLRLVRASIGDWTIGTLQPGDYLVAEAALPQYKAKPRSNYRNQKSGSSHPSSRRTRSSQQRKQQTRHTKKEDRR